MEARRRSHLPCSHVVHVRVVKAIIHRFNPLCAAFFNLEQPTQLTKCFCALQKSKKNKQSFMAWRTFLQVKQHFEI